MNRDPDGIPGRWNQRKRDIGTVVWISFLAACVGTLVIFAVLDPAALNDAWVLPWEMGSKLAYSLGFAFLFCVSLVASVLTVFMIRTGPATGHYRGKDGKRVPEVRESSADDPDLGINSRDWL